MKAIVISITKDKAKMIFAGNPNDARDAYREATDGEEIQMWTRAKGCVKKKRGNPKPKRGRKPKKSVEDTPNKKPE